MSGYWLNFVKTGNPNSDHLPEWKKYSTRDKEVMMLGETQQSQPLKDYEELDFL